jgi:hypothetical protein
MASGLSPLGFGGSEGGSSLIILIVGGLREFGPIGLEKS